MLVRICALLLVAMCWAKVSLAQQSQDVVIPEPVNDLGLLSEDYLEAVRSGRSVPDNPGWPDHSLWELLDTLKASKSSLSPACKAASSTQEQIELDRDSLVESLAQRYGLRDQSELKKLRPWKKSMSKDSSFLWEVATRLLEQDEVVGYYEQIVPLLCSKSSQHKVQLDGNYSEIQLLALEIARDIPSDGWPEWARISEEGWSILKDLPGEPGETIVLDFQEEGVSAYTAVWQQPMTEEQRDSTGRPNLGHLWRNYQGQLYEGFRTDAIGAIFNIINIAATGKTLDLNIDGVFAPHAFIDLSKMNFSQVTIRESVFRNINLYRSTFEDIDLRTSTFARISLDGTRGRTIDIRDVSYLALPNPPDAQIDLDYSAISSLNIDGVKPGKRIFADLNSGTELDLVNSDQIEAERLSLRLLEANVETWLDVQNAELLHIRADHIQVAGQAYLEEVDVAKFTRFDNGHFEEMELNGFTLPSDPTGDDGMLNLGSIVVNAELQLNNVEANEVYAAKAQVAVIRSENLVVGDLFSLWGSQAEAIFLKLTNLNRTDFGLLESDYLSLEDSNGVWTGEQLIGRYMEVRYLIVRNAKLGALNFEGLRSEVTKITCTSIDAALLAERSMADELHIDRVNATSLDLRRGNFENVLFTRPELELEPEPFGNALPQSQSGTDQEQTTNRSIDNNANTVDEWCSDGSAPQGTYKQIWLESSNIQVLHLRGKIEEAIHAPRLRVEKFAFSSDSAELGPNAIVNLHQASIGSLSLPENKFRHTENHQPQLWLDGAEVENVRIYDPNRDSTGLFAKTEERDGYRPIEYDPANMSPYKREHYVSLLFNELLPSLSLSASDRTIENYRGATYMFLRRSMEEAGFPGLARDTAVLQNDHYAMTLGTNGTLVDNISGWLLRGIYRLSKIINQYGYDNGRAVLWLIALWLAGLGVLIFEHRRRPQAPPYRFSRRDPKIWQALFLSADRTIPTLGIDENFSRPAHIEGTPSRTPLITILLYCQRFLAFIVVLFMVGGVLDVFQ